jgi:octanoyl-[GcvH]:protein N-octanoyltransferase
VGDPADLDLVLDEPRSPAEAVAVSAVLLEEVAAGERRPLLRLIVPRATMAFGRLDELTPCFPAAVHAAEACGFTPVVRAPGGRAVAYHEGCLVVEETGRGTQAFDRLEHRFREKGDLLAGALRSLGVDARVGAVAGEYCPGSYSVNARGASKLIGTAQRVLRDGWLFASVITVRDTAPLSAAMGAVYGALGVPMDPSSVGGVADEVPSVGVAEVRSAVVDAYRTRFGLRPGAIGPATLAAARDRIDRHRVAVRER